MAQLGSVLPWGGRGRRFKSCRSDFFKNIINNNQINYRDVAQPGSAPCSGRGGRKFESCHPDFFIQIFFDLSYIKLTSYCDNAQLQ